MSINNAKPITTNNYSNVIISAKPATANTNNYLNVIAGEGGGTDKSVKIATSNLFINTENIPNYKSLEDIVLQTLNPGEVLDYGDTNLVIVSGNNSSNNSSIDSTFTTIQTNPLDILSSTSALNSILSTFYSSLYIYTPKIGTGPQGQIVYFDESNNLVINTVNVRGVDEVEVEFWKYETELNDTIYS